MAHDGAKLTPMKKCYTCWQVLPLNAFAPSVARRRKNGICKACRSEYGKKYYRRRKKEINQHRRVNRWRYRRNRIRIAAYLLSHACVDCGESDPRVLEFDHVRGEKDQHISDLVNDGRGWERILSEIAKCDVRCANCHRRRTVEHYGKWAHNRGVAQLGRAPHLGCGGSAGSNPVAPTTSPHGILAVGAPVV